MKLDVASDLIALAQREAEKIGVAMTVAVVDSGGHLVALSRMDGASFLTVEIATGKAYTAAAFGTSSEDLEKRFEGRGQFTASIAIVTHGRFTLRMGGLPIVIDGQVIGAIGASGGTGEQDVEVATAALAAKNLA
jgi:uncharacterized protein GlcG (DUF336 family)